MNFISHIHQVLEVKNEWSHTSVLPASCHGIGRDSIIFCEIYSHDLDPVVCSLMLKS